MAKLPSYSIPDFDPATHTYNVKGVKVPGFTEIAKAEELIDYDGVRTETLEWAKDRGTKIHMGCDLIDQGTLDWLTVADEIKGYLEAYQKFKKETKFVAIDIELPLYNPAYRYACKVDRIGVFASNKNSAVLEIKTTVTEMPSHILQVVAQSLCITPLKLPYLLYLHSDVTYKLKMVKEIEFGEYKNVWLSAVILYQYKRKKRGG